MIMPVFALYAQDLDGYSATLTGLALGIYGLTQALFQIPLGMLSDRIGRKPVIIGGLVVFALGSVVAALADDMTGVIIGRALQGTGAIASAVMALAADLTREEHRMKMFATIGISIGLSFAVAMVVGPVLHGWFGVSGIFWITALLAVGGILLVIVRVPHATCRFHRDAEVEVGWFSHALKDPQLLRLDAGIFVLHFILMATFLVMPLILQQQLDFEVAKHWQIYLPVLFFSMLAVAPFIFLAEKKRKLKQVLVGAVLILTATQVLFPTAAQSMVGLVFVIWLFFTAFNLLEASMPSLVAKKAPAEHKGTAMGVYSSFQFLGIFFGGLVGGWCYGHYGVAGVFAINALLAGGWVFLALSMRAPHYLSSHLLNVGEVNKAQAEALAMDLSKVPGVAEAVVVAEDGVAYLKVDNRALDREALYAFSVSEV